MARGIARAASFGGRAAAAGWFSYRRITVAVCIANLVAALLVLRSLTSFAPAPKREAPALAAHRRAHDDSGSIRDLTLLFFRFVFQVLRWCSTRRSRLGGWRSRSGFAARPSPSSSSRR
uniref:Uncharacterized protein n=1 Tax=Aegilops tauschii subsp. strangulata TaxID=200361 RepID=A0A453PNW6_AEGTS